MEFNDQIAAWQEALAAELAGGRLRFPDVLDISFNIKEIAGDPESSMRQISDVVQRHEAFSNKVMKMSNMLAFNPSFSRVRTVKDAVNRIGILAIRCLAFAVAAEELIDAEKNPALHRVASEHWKHTVEVATSAYVLGQHSGGGEPGTDLLAGLLLNVAEFFLLDRVNSYPVFAQSLPRFAAAVVALRRQVRQSILVAFDIPEHIRHALPVEDRLTPVSWPPGSLGETLIIARLFATTPNPFDVLAGLPQPTPALIFGSDFRKTAVLEELRETVRADRQPLIAALRN